jgi:hypothetical protein
LRLKLQFESREFSAHERLCPKLLLGVSGQARRIAGCESSVLIVGTKDFVNKKSTLAKAEAIQQSASQMGQSTISVRRSHSCVPLREFEPKLRIRLFIESCSSFMAVSCPVLREQPLSDLFG